MEFGLNEEQVLLKNSIHALCKKLITSELNAKWDEEAIYPQEILNVLAEGGYLGLGVSEKYGGSAGHAMDAAVVLETLAYHSLAVSQAYYSLVYLGAEAFGRLGTEEQKSEVLPKLVNGKYSVAFALTEPNSGSDAISLKAKAVSSGDNWVIDGQKVFITGAKVSNDIITAVRTDPESSGKRGISLLIVDSKSPGLEIRPIKKLGLKAIDLNELFFDNVKVPIENVLGNVDQGWSHLRTGLAKERFCLGAISAGAAQRVVDDCVNYAKERKQFGQSISNFQMITQKIVDMQVAVDAARLLTYKAGWMIDQGQDAVKEASMAKLHATETYNQVVNEGMQIFGGYSFTMEYDIQRHYRDVRYLTVGGGTSEIQRIVIGKKMVL